jgi:hypothetical protein
MGRDSDSRPPVCETGILTRLDYPSTAFAFEQPIIYVKQASSGTQKQNFSKDYNTSNSMTYHLDLS